MLESFYPRLRLILACENLTDAYVAKKLDIPIEDLEQYKEGNAYPSFDRLKKVADLFNIDHRFFEVEKVSIVFENNEYSVEIHPKKKEESTGD